MQPAAASRLVPLSTPAAAASEPVTVAIDDVARLCTEQGNPGNRAGIRSIDVSIPRRLLEPGLTIIDTPGVGGLDSTQALIVAAKALAVVPSVATEDPTVFWHTGGLFDAVAALLGGRR